MPDPSGSAIRVGGFEGLSLCDWPGQITATIFCQGCPWDCPYCHNPHLIPSISETELEWSGILRFLETRRGLIDGVVFSGGEPTLQKGLEEAIHQVRSMGFRIGLHSAGPYPERLASVLPLVDWIGFDVKAAFADYEQVTRTPKSGSRARKSLEHVLGSGIDYQIRTTIDPTLLDDEAIKRLKADLAAFGVQDHKLQEMRLHGVRPGTRKS